MSTLLDIGETLSEHAEAIDRYYQRSDYIGALRSLNHLANDFTEFAGELAQEAYNAGVTKKAMAEALGVPPSTFRGMSKTSDGLDSLRELLP
jgi:hypothetical protein